MNGSAKKRDDWRAEARLIVRQAARVWHLIAPRHRGSLIAAACLMMVVSGCGIAFPLLLGRMLDQVKAGSEQGLHPHGLYGIVIAYLLLIAGVFVVREGVQVVRRYLVENACTRIGKDMTVDLFSHLLKMDLSKLTHDKIGALEGRISRCIVGFIRFIRLEFLDFLPPFCLGLFSLIAAVSKQPVLGVVMVGVIPTSLYLTLRQLQSQKGIRLAILRSQEEMEGSLVEQLYGLEYVRAADTHEQEVERLADAAERRRTMEIRHHFEMSLFGSGKALNEAFFHILVLAMAAYFAVRGTISIGDVLTFSLLFVNVMVPLNEVHRGLDEGHECSLLIDDLLAMLEEPLDVSFALTLPKQPSVAAGQPLVVVKDLVVKYQTESGNKQALNGVSITICHGETVGLAGPSGCGKTTWLRVLLRLTHPTSGEVLFGGVPLEFVSRAAIGKMIGYVGQSPYVFTGTIEENIRYGCPEASERAIREAADRACLHEEILAMPGAYRALVTERGMNLSAGQRQRLALARTFLKDPPVLILDEGTSALDTISERSIQHTLNLVRKDRTVIMVAHRLSTLLYTDRIFVFQDGRVVESGSYDELCQLGGVFDQLVKCAQSDDNAPLAPQAKLVSAIA